MPSPIRSQPPVDYLDSTPKILESRDQYRSCHICLPEEEYRVPAVIVDSKYYSLAKVVQDRPRSLEIAKRLQTAGTEAVITKVAKGYAVWRLEPEAYTELCPRTTRSRHSR